ncbi:MAG: peptidylprolyl isomerase [Methanospirillum sp.]|nr:peptidylprolyl isomerase [Methanospirillum sp.]
MDKRFTMGRNSTWLGIAGVILLFSAALLCGCTSTSPQGTTEQATPVLSPTGENVTGGAQDGDMVEVDYVGTLENGTEFDSSKKTGPFSLILGSGGAIPGFDKALHGMKAGESKKFTLAPDEAYGQYDPARVVDMPIDFIPKGENATVGQRVTLFDGGQLFQATVKDLNATNVTFDLNSPLAGKTLTFDVTVRNITPIDIVSENQSEQKENNLSEKKE